MDQRRTQEESEQPAKVYQLDAVVAAVNEVNGKMDRLLSQTTGLVSEAKLADAKKELTDYVDDAIEKVDLRYGPMKQNLSWFIRGIIGQGIVILGGIIYLYIITKK